MRSLSGVVLALGLALPLTAGAQEEAVEIPPPPAVETPPPPPSAPAEAPPSSGLGLATPEGYERASPEPAPRPYGAPRGGRHDGRVHLEVVSSGGDRPLTLHLRDGNEEEVESCTAPCVLDVLPGMFDLAVSPSGGGPRRADDGRLDLRAGHQIAVVHYDHRIGLRSLGWTFVSVALSALAASAPFLVFQPVLTLITGVPIAVAFLIPAIPLIFLEDSARVEVFSFPE